MNFRIADTFTDSLAKLNGEEKKQVKTTAFDLQLNPANPGMQFHKLDRAKDPNFWSVRGSRDIRLIVHKTDMSLLLCGVLGQRIFQPPFSWKALGVDIRGRSRTLHINYRTSHQIRMQADRLLGPEVSDVDGNTEERRGTVFVFNGPTPGIQILDTIEDERNTVSQWLSERNSERVLPEEPFRRGELYRQPVPGTWVVPYGE